LSSPPSLALVMLSDGKVFCPAALVSAGSVVATASCGLLLNIKTTYAYLGITDWSRQLADEVIQVSSIVVNEVYNSTTLDNNIAIFFLKGDSRMSPASLPNVATDLSSLSAFSWMVDLHASSSKLMHYLDVLYKPSGAFPNGTVNVQSVGEGDPGAYSVVFSSDGTVIGITYFDASVMPQGGMLLLEVFEDWINNASKSGGTSGSGPVSAKAPSEIPVAEGE